MNYAIEYFHARVKAEIESWPDGILADYARMVELLMEFGPNLRMPHSRAMGGGLFELRPRGREGIGRAFYCFVISQRVVILHAFVKKTQDTREQELRIARKKDEGDTKCLNWTISRFPMTMKHSSRRP